MIDRTRSMVITGMQLAFWMIVAVSGVSLVSDLGAAKTTGSCRLPADSKDVVELGNGWNSFSLTLGGIDHRFLHKSVIEGLLSRETITEITRGADRGAR